MLGGGEEVAAGRAAATRSSGCWGAVEAWRTGAPGAASWGGGDVGGVRAFVGTGARPMPVKASATPSPGAGAGAAAAGGGEARRRFGAAAIMAFVARSSAPSSSSNESHAARAARAIARASLEIGCSGPLNVMEFVAIRSMSAMKPSRSR